MSRDILLRTLAEHLGDQWAELSLDIGNLADLTTVEKGNLVAALNSLKTRVDNATDVDDANVSTTSTYSSSKIADLIQAAKDDILGPDVAPALDTLKEIGQALNENSELSDTILVALGKRVRVDAAQSFTDTEKTQGRANIGAASQADHAALSGTVGNVSTVADRADAAAVANAGAHTALTTALGALNTDYVAVYEAAKAARIAAA